MSKHEGWLYQVRLEYSFRAPGLDGAHHVVCVMREAAEKAAREYAERQRGSEYLQLRLEGKRIDSDPSNFGPNRVVS